MDVKYKSNVLKPGDQGFEYDKEVEFEKGEESNEWDASESFE